MKRTGPDEATRTAVYERDHWRCVRCGDDTCLQLHHRRPRAMGGSRDPQTNSPDNLLTLCEPCHGWVESHREEALRLGLLVRQGVDPATIAVAPDCGPVPHLDAPAGAA